MIDRARRLLTGLDRWSSQHRTTRVARRAVVGFMRHDALQYAGSMAYFGILSIFQLLVLGIVSFSFFLGEGGAREFVLNEIRASTPIDPTAMGKVIDNVIQSRGGISLVGVVLLVWSALGIFSALSRGISRAFAAPEPRPFVQDKLLGLALMAMSGGLAVIAVLIGVASGIMQQTTGDVISAVPGGSLALSLVGAVLPVLLVFVALLMLYRLVPNRSDVSLADVWPGALVAAILWSVLRFGFTYYATRVARYDSVFGSLSTGISLLVFLYFASIVLLLGAEVARAKLVEDGKEDRGT